MCGAWGMWLPRVGFSVTECHRSVGCVVRLGGKSDGLYDDVQSTTLVGTGFGHWNQDF